MQITLAANEHRAFDIASLFNNQPQPYIKSAVISNAGGIIGLEMFGSLRWHAMEGILLTDRTAATLYYPYVADDDWWTGIVAYNPSSALQYHHHVLSCRRDPSFSPDPPSISGKEKYVGTVLQLGLPVQTAWFRIDSTGPFSGFELFGARRPTGLRPMREGAGPARRRVSLPRSRRTGGPVLHWSTRRPARHR